MAIPVVGLADVVRGMLRLKDVRIAIESGMELSTTVGQLAIGDTPVLSPEELLEPIVQQPPQLHRQFAVVDLDGRLVGLLDLDSLRLPAEMVT